MKIVKQVCLVIAILTVPFTTMAELNKRNLWIALSLTPVAFFHETTLHELAHATTAKLYVPSANITRFSPYPCYIKNNFHFGCFEVTWPRNVEVSNRVQFNVSIAPYVLGTSAFVISDILLSTKLVRPDRPAGAILFVMGMVAPYVEFVANFAFKTNNGDWQDIRKRSQNYSLVDIIGGAMLVIGTYRIISQGIAVFRR